MPKSILSMHVITTEILIYPLIAISAIIILGLFLKQNSEIEIKPHLNKEMKKYYKEYWEWLDG